MIVDSHCHLADEAFAADLDAVVARARAAGVGLALSILDASEPAELERARTVLRAAWPDLLFAAAVHPHKAGAFASARDDVVTATRRALSRTGAVAIGEIGLDYHYDFAPREVQQAVFAAQVALAVDTGLPVIVHTREAGDDTIGILSNAGRGSVRGVMHCFTGSADEARRALDLGFSISFSGILTFPRAGKLRDVAAMVPADRLLVETDAPYLAPVPHRGRRNEPAWVVETLVCLAGIHGRPVDEMAAGIEANFRALFRAA